MSPRALLLPLVTVVRVVTIVLAFGIVAAAPRDAAAQKGPERVFAGKVMLSDKRFPSKAKSPDAYTAAVKKQAKTSFIEDKKTGEWNIYFAAFLRAPLDDLEYSVKLFDVSDKAQALLVAFDQYTDVRGQRTLLSSFTLERKTVGVNKLVLIVIESKGKIMSSAKFQIIGEADKHSGKVDFTDDDGKDKYE